MHCQCHPNRSDQTNMAFMGRGFTFGGQESLGLFLVQLAVCKIQASKHHVDFLPLVLKDNRSCFSQDERSGVQLHLDHAIALALQIEVGRLIGIWKPVYLLKVQLLIAENVYSQYLLHCTCSGQCTLSIYLASFTH